MDVDLKDLTQLAGGNHFHHLAEGFLQTALLMDKQPGGAGLIGVFIELDSLVVRNSSGLFQHHILAGLQSHHSVIKMVAGTGGDINHFDILLLEHLGVIGILLAAGIQLGNLGGPLGNQVAGGHDSELLRILAEFGFCHRPADSAKAHKTHLDNFVHFQIPLLQ